MPVLRRAIASISLLAVGLLGPISIASAEEPDVEIPAGEFCPGFAVVGHATGKEGSEKTLPGDRFWSHNVANGIWANAESGQTYTQRSRYVAVVTYDEADNDFHVTINGRFMIGFAAGDVGLTGLVTETQTFSVAGHQMFTYDVDTNRISEYSLDGVVLADVCAVLAGEG
ncbi:hypothetical protein [Paenarthrobacter nitroguajacolicus]